jgi:beta-glucosidase
MKYTELVDFTVDDFGSDFIWGVGTSAFQTEGSINVDGKGPSIWDNFTEKKGNIRNGENAIVSSNFYNRYAKDLEIIRELNFKSFRFSLSWPRILPQGHGYINRMGIDYYNRVIDECLENDIIPWITLYHWDLPQALENKGGWTNRDVVKWFLDYVNIVSAHYGDRVKHWMILNEPVSFTALGYYFGTHAPGRKGLRNFLPAVHHAALCQSVGGLIIKENVRNALIGNCFSFSVVEPINNNPRNLRAALKLDAAMNRLFLEPALGMGYPFDKLPLLKAIEKYILPGDMELLPFEFDFIGVQYYFRIIASYSYIPPFVKEISAKRRNVPLSTMNYEIFPQGIYAVLKWLNAYKGIKKIIITESGSCFPDILNKDNTIHDEQRTDYFIMTLRSLLQAKRENIPVDGLFVWSLTDNFEWAEGYNSRFGLVYIDYKSQSRFLKDSGKWFKKFLKTRKPV